MTAPTPAPSYREGNAVQTAASLLLAELQRLRAERDNIVSRLPALNREIGRIEAVLTLANVNTETA